MGILIAPDSQQDPAVAELHTTSCIPLHEPLAFDNSLLLLEPTSHNNGYKRLLSWVRVRIAILRRARPYHPNTQHL